MAALGALAGVAPVEVVVATQYLSVEAAQKALFPQADRFNEVILSLSAAQRASIGWRNRQGIGDSGNQFHYLGVQATRWSLARADRRSGRRNLWLRALDAAGMGFDS